MHARAARWLILLLTLHACAPARTQSRRAPEPTPVQETKPAQESRPANAPPSDLTAAAEANVVANPKHKLSCLFLEDKDGTEYVVLRDDATGRRARYFPTKQPGGGADTAERYYRDVWSPDGEYLALPLNPFEGFCVIKAKGALDTIKRRRCDDFIRVLDYRPRADVKEVAYHHEWNRWEAATAFSFRAGLSGNDKIFVYDIGRGELYDGEARKAEYLAYLKERAAKDEAREVGRGKRGRVEIVESFSGP
jgi:hypothetical protein